MSKFSKAIPVIAVITSLTALAPLSVALAKSPNKVDPVQIARGAKAWANNCGRCHNLRSPNELTDADWDVSVSHMRVRANLPGNVSRDIKAFLKNSN
jgi:cytochrome c1